MMNNIGYADLLSRLYDGTALGNSNEDGNNKLTFSNEKNVQLADQLLEQWKAGSFCDVTFRVGAGTVQAHRCVLAACCKYFNTMFSSNFVEKTVPEIDLGITFQSIDTLKIIIGSVYGSPLEICEENVQELIQGADLFGLTDLLEHCVFFLLSNLQLSNLLWTWTVADMYSLEEVALVCNDLAICRFGDTLIHLDETLSLPTNHLLKFFEKGIAKFCDTKILEQFLTKYLSDDKKSDVKKSLQEAISTGNQVQLPCERNLKQSKVESDSDKGKIEKLSNVKHKSLPSATNIKAYAEEVSDKEWLAMIKNSGARPKIKSCDVDQLEEVVLVGIAGIKETQWCLYSVSRDQWFTSPGSYSAIPPEWRMKLYGVGPNQDYALLECIIGQNYKLLNMKDFSVKDVPEVPNVGPASEEAGSVREQTVVLAVGEELLAVLLNRRMVPKSQHKNARNKKKGNIQPWQENMQLSGKTEIMYGVYIQKYNFEKGEWCYASKVYDARETISRVHCIQRLDGNVYILLFRKSCIFLGMYSPNTNRYRILRPLTREVPQLSWPQFGEHAATFFGTEHELVIHHANNSVMYHIASGIWTKKKETPLLPSLTELGFSGSAKQHVFCQSDSSGKVFLRTENIVGRSYFMWYLPQSKVYRHLAPFPTTPVTPSYNQGNCFTVPASLIDQLSPVSLMDQLQKCILSTSNAWICMNKYKKRTGTDTESNLNNCNCPGCSITREQGLGLMDEDEQDDDDDDFDDDYPENVFDFMYDSDDKYMFGYGTYGTTFDDYYAAGLDDDDYGDY